MEVLVQDTWTKNCLSWKLNKSRCFTPRKFSLCWKVMERRLWSPVPIPASRLGSPQGLHRSGEGGRGQLFLREPRMSPDPGPQEGRGGGLMGH